MIYNLYFIFDCFSTLFLLPCVRLHILLVLVLLWTCKFFTILLLILMIFEAILADNQVLRFLHFVFWSDLLDSVRVSVRL